MRTQNRLKPSAQFKVRFWRRFRLPVNWTAPVQCNEVIMGTSKNTYSKLGRSSCFFRLAPPHPLLPRPTDFHLAGRATNREAAIWSAEEWVLGRGFAWSPAVSSSAESGSGAQREGRLVSVWKLNFLLRTFQTGSKWSPHGNLMIQSLCDVSGETDTGGKIVPCGEHHPLR